MTLKLSDLPEPVLVHDGSRQWYRFANAVTVTYGKGKRGDCFCCHTDLFQSNCIHIRKMQQVLGVTDWRNKRPEEMPF